MFIAETVYLVHEHCWLNNTDKLNPVPESVSDIGELVFLTPQPTFVPPKNRKGKYKT